MKCFFNKITSDRKIDIFGSCVTRDLFECKNADKLSVGEYIARQSLFSAFAPPIHWEKDEISALTSDFQKRLLINDFEKLSFNRLKESNNKYLIIDFIDERFNIVRVNNSYLTYSAELMRSEYLNNKEYSIIDKKLWTEEELKANMFDKVEKFAYTISQIYKKRHIILHRAKMCDEYIGKDGEIKAFHPSIIESNKKINYILDCMYDWISVSLRKDRIIDFSCGGGIKLMRTINGVWELCIIKKSIMKA